jgi:cell division protein FtsB
MALGAVFFSVRAGNVTVQKDAYSQQLTQYSDPAEQEFNQRVANLDRLKREEDVLNRETHDLIAQRDSLKDAAIKSRHK